ncbi:hypothetical protein M2T82_00970 [Elizabethkingia ursingii]|uniref:hypothetical protein n=1 Tax=Elizabethkingia ursingii TaxID=1756150 RepID=UPI002011FBE4|nr:hypothetical protein [Elizabethkingia ursingii]MCL1666624.1 hypothetical protein [Elizabethkingia ursingii]
MKKLVLALGIISSAMVFGQSYIDSNGNLQRKPYQYRDPQQLSIANLGNAASTLQNRYNRNTELVQDEVDAILRKVRKMDYTDEQITQITNTFLNTAVKSINSQRINYASDYETKSVINYLYESMNKILEKVGS